MTARQSVWHPADSNFPARCEAHLWAPDRAPDGTISNLSVNDLSVWAQVYTGGGTALSHNNQRVKIEVRDEVWGSN